MVVLSSQMEWKMRSLASFLLGLMMMQPCEQKEERLHLVDVVAVAERLLLAGSFPQL